MKVIIGADHAGFYYKEKIKSYLEKMGYSVEDLGAFELKKNDDYPDYAIRVAKLVSSLKDAKGILFCGTGAGMVIVANKIKGIRAVEVYDFYTSKMAREHNDANVVAIGARNTNYEKAKKLVDIFLKTKFSKAERHIRRIKKINNYEN